MTEPRSTSPFHANNLRGRSFKGQNLSGQDFSYADIRGADFSHAILTGANFSNSRAGLRQRWQVSLIAIAWIQATLSGYIIGFTAALTSKSPLEADFGRVRIVSLLMLTAFFALLIRKGLSVSLSTFGAIVAASVILTAALAQPGSQTNLAAIVIIKAIAIAGAAAGVASAGIAGAIIYTIASLSVWVLVGGGTAMGAIAGLLEGLSPISHATFWDWILTSIVTGALLVLSVYMSVQAISGNAKYILIRIPSVNLCTNGGTSFRAADLTDADFTQAHLKHVDFRKATLTHTCWFQAQQLALARIEGTLLENTFIRNLAVSKNGQNQIFDYLSLRGLNLQGSQLADASFINADLSETKLQNADLSNTKLAWAKLYRADLRQSCLTGAYIQDWAISTDTQFEDITCRYIYMQLPTKADPDPCRKPDNRNEFFQTGDFADFIAPIIKTLNFYRQQNVDPRRMATVFRTLDLYHYEGIDPSAVAIALKQLAEQHPEANLQVVALEGRGEEKIRLQAKVTGTSDRSQLSNDYFEKYRQVSALPYPDLQALLVAMTEKDERIRSLEAMVTTAMKSDKIYVETYYALGSTSSNQPVKKILILTANPQNTNKRRLDEEVRDIQAGLERAKKRDRFEIISKWAVRSEDLRRALLDNNPQIVHFSGYGMQIEGLALETDTGQIQVVSTNSLASLFKLFKDEVECVLLNACYSDVQADAISQHIEYVIGMHHDISNRAAIKFAVGFYDAIGAGRSIVDAFELGCIAIELENIPESLTPVLKRRGQDN